MISRVIRQDVTSSGDLDSLVRVRAPSERVAKKRAKSRSVLHAGLSPTVLRRDGVVLKYTEVREDITTRVGDVWLVQLEIKNLYK